MQSPDPSQPAPETLNVIVLAPPAALASRIACRSDPGPVSAVLVTAKVAAIASETQGPKMTIRADAGESATK